MSFFLALVFLVVGGLAFFGRNELDILRANRPEADMLMGFEPQEIAVLATGMAVVLLVVPSLIGAYRGRTRSALRDLIAWSFVGMLAGGAYSYRDELGDMAYRIAGELAPAAPVPAAEPAPGSERSHRIKRRRDGHFTASVTVNGASVQMLVDTGASTVVLRQADARKLGVDTGNLKYTVPVQTANGVAYAAQIRLRNASIGNITLSGIDALVAQPGVLKESLLGMTFLSRLRSYEFAGQYLTFRN